MAIHETILNAVVDPLSSLIQTKTVFGDPLVLGNVTLIPVVDVMFGYGAGGGEGTTAGNAGTGGGGGGGARVSAKAVIVIKGDEVSFLALTKGGAIEKILDSVPGLIDKVQAGMSKKAE